MAVVTIPNRVDGCKLVEVNQHVSGIIPGESLERLNSAVSSVSGEVSCELVFDRDVERNRIVSGSCHTSVVMVCQRCLGDVSIELDGKVTIGLVFDDDHAKKLPKRLDPVELDEEGHFFIWEMIEDELLLCLPEFPMHKEGECEAFKIVANESSTEDVERSNPFDVLAKLKQK